MNKQLNLPSVAPHLLLGSAQTLRLQKEPRPIPSPVGAELLGCPCLTPPPSAAGLAQGQVSLLALFSSEWLPGHLGWLLLFGLAVNIVWKKS